MEETQYKIEIRKLIPEDIDKIASLHKSVFDKEHFSAIFSKSLLKKYFGTLIAQSSFKYVAVSKNDSSIIGYLLAGYNFDIAVSKFQKKNIVQLLFILLRSRKFLIEKISEFIATSSGAKNSESELRLYLIAAKSNINYRGIGKNMISNFEMDLAEHKLKNYGLSVRMHNEKAIKFYLNLGFKEEFRTKKSIYFVKHLEYRSACL